MLAIAGGKGGVGKTTFALALARSLAHRGDDPLVFDADVDMPDLHVLAGVDREPTAHEFVDGRPLGTVVHQSRRLPGVSVVTAGKPATVPEALARLRQWGGPVLVDCPAGASADAARPLRECDRSVLVSTNSPAAIEDTVKTAAIARRLGSPPVAVLLRGKPETADGVFDCPIEHLPTVDTTPVETDPRLQAVCASLSQRLSAQCPLPGNPPGRFTDRTWVGVGDDRFGQ